MLYPRANGARSVTELGGLWKFKLDEEEKGFEAGWIRELPLDAELLAVPASYNEQREQAAFRDHCGWAFYEYMLQIPVFYEGQRMVLRFDAVTHWAKVYLNGTFLCEHKGGFLPFEAEITECVHPGTAVRLVVAVNNEINHGTLPIGNEGTGAFFGSDNPGIPSVEAAKLYRKKQNVPNFDFFNYAGINRPVRLYTTPQAYIDDITVVTEFQESAVTRRAEEAVAEKAEIRLYVRTAGYKTEAFPRVRILDESGFCVGEQYMQQKETDCWEVCMELQQAKLWEPAPGKPYLYHAEIQYDEDRYVQPFGIRSVRVSGAQFLLNGQPFYFKGCCKHEDVPIHGRGFDLVYDVKDISMLKWLHANSIRTSHYPYAEEMYELCDREGIVVIDETPAVGIGAGADADPYRTFRMHAHHEDVIREYIARDKNHPCVVMWSLGNEPDLEHFPESAYAYWHRLYELAHSEDPQNRPVTVVCCQNDYTKDITTRTMDVICINRYYGWYNLSGDMDAACYGWNIELDFWEKTGKPVMCSEYGVDTIEGVHQTIPEMFSEEYQIEFYRRTNEQFDRRSFMIGEHVWNFADFRAFQGPMRADGNRKGILTRDRRPKMAAHWLRSRWEQIPNYGYKQNG